MGEGVNEMKIIIAVSAVCLSVVEIWSIQVMYRRPIAVMLLRYMIDFLFALLLGAAVAMSGFSVRSAIWATALLAGGLYGFVFFDAMTVFDCYERGTEAAE